MRAIGILLAVAALAAEPAAAADQLKFGPAPAWVASQTYPTEATKASGAPFAVLLSDSQSRMEPGRITSFTEFVIKVQSPEGLAAGNIGFAWQPSTDTVTVNKLHIVRGGQVIDVIKSGQTFTVARREANLEAATLDGTLTANIQPEGLQVGDIIALAVTTEHVDPVMKGHVEGTYGLWNEVSLEKGHAMVSWPAGLELFTRQTPQLPLARQSTAAGWKSLELAAEKVEPLLLPRDAPMRFRVGRAGEVTDYRSWSNVAELMAPLYEQAAVIPKAGPLRDEVERIRATAKTPKERAEKALQLVEDKIRYVALLMGTGGYVPASAETSWSRRFGDCKAKTALLVALLRELGIPAVPVAVHSRIGDALPERLPMVAYFDHVIVRAQVAGKTYWLDGTRSGDSRLDLIPVPPFEWGLPLERGATLVPIVQQPLDRPSSMTKISIDAGKGIFAPAPFKVEQLVRGDSARMLHLLYSKLSANQLDQALRDYWRASYDFVDIKAVNTAFDKDQAELRISMAGEALLEWDDGGWLFVPGSTLAFEPDFNRAEGPFREAPFQIGFPQWETTEVIVQLPAGFAAGQQKTPPPIGETLAGVEYSRQVRLAGSALTVETKERSIAAEVPYKQAIAAKPRLKALYDEDVYLRVPASYRASEADWSGLAARKLGTGSEYVWRGNMYLNAGKFDPAIADFTEAYRLDPADKWALANRGISHVWKREFVDAERDLAAAEKLQADHPVVLRARGLMAEMKGELEAAELYFTKALAADPGNSFALVHRASVRSSQEMFDQALADLNSVLAKEPSNPLALSARASVHHSLGADEKALADSEAVLRDGNAPPQLRLLRANIFRGQGKHELVLKEAELLMAEHPGSEFALVAAGKIFSAEGKRDRALQAIDRAIAVKPQAYIYVNRAEVRDRADGAGRLADLEKALALEPEHPEALAMKASLLLRQDQHSSALQLYDRALKANPDPPLYLRRGRAVALFKSGRTEEARTAFAQIRQMSKQPGDLNSLCWDKATAGILLESAVEDCTEALKLRPDTAAYLDSLGLALLRLGKVDKAIETYGRAIAKARLSASFMGRAIAHARKGNLALANADRAEALKIDADAERRFADYGLELDAADRGKAGQ